MQVNQYFTHENYPGKGNRIYIVTEHYSMNNRKIIGVVSGVESVCVINSGLGMTGSLRKYIESILGTDKTIECISLTGQPDNVGGSAAFDVRYITPEEKTVYDKAGSNMKLRRQLFDRLSEGSEESGLYADKLAEDSSKLDFLEAGDGIFRGEEPVGPHMFDKLADGYLFHLGGTVVEMTSLPAQSDGQLIAICPTCCISFTGEALDNITKLMYLDRPRLERYAECLERVIEYVKKDSPYAEGLGSTPHIFYSDHSPVPFGVQVAEDVLQSCREVLAGKTEGDIPAGGEAAWRMHFVNNSGIVYSRDLIG